MPFSVGTSVTKKQVINVINCVQPVRRSNLLHFLGVRLSLHEEVRAALLQRHRAGEPDRHLGHLGCFFCKLCPKESVGKGEGAREGARHEAASPTKFSPSLPAYPEVQCSCVMGTAASPPRGPGLFARSARASARCARTAADSRTSAGD